MNNNNAEVVVLSGSNFKRWKEDLEFALGMADIDQALRENEPPALTDSSTAAQKEHYARWERSNRLCILAFKRSIAEHLKSGLPETTNAKKFLAQVEERYLVSNKAETGDLMSKLAGIKYDNSGGVRDHILKMVHIQSKLKALDITLPDPYIVHSALNSLPAEFSQMKTAYNTQNEAWSINDLISKCVVEEEKIRREKGQIALFVSHDSRS
ncbi:uncharacterized protein LOC132631514 [Lycium barbarum]|uniref:uncharacterized protein LOC132631514 n=1 Tax=Lycium barbarum TaxID=112863 RepID=UPI00293EB7BC|nr:uncharacterized protein LOC132631514 [Lycium barbarum]